MTSSGVIGGEFYAEAESRSLTPSIDTSALTFLSGGKACLSVICRWLLSEGIGEILLPEYLCPTIIDTLEHWGLGYDFYGINADLRYNLPDLERKARQFQTILFINYFGFSPQPQDSEALDQLQSAGKYLIEDNAQRGFWQHSRGDFVFNSLRKLVPHDGGYLQSCFDVTAALPADEPTNRRLDLIREYRRKLREYLLEDEHTFAEVSTLYERAEEAYNLGYTIRGDGTEKRGIESLDWPAIVRQRRLNYNVLLESISGLPGVEPVFGELTEDAVPLGLPVYLSGRRRDELCACLAEEGVGVTIHWEGLDSDPRLPWDVAAKPWGSRMLTLPVDQRYTGADMLRLADILAKVLRA